MPAVTVPQAFALALQHHQAGRLEQAEALFQQILALQPQHAGALHHLGLIAHQAAQYERAVGWMRQATLLEPGNYAAHSNLGEAWRLAGHLEEAVACYHRALELRPDRPEIHNNLGLALAAQGWWEEGAAAYGRALQLRPDYPEAHYNLGTLLAGRERFDEAIAAFRRALELKPAYPQAWTNLGGALTGQERFEEAVAAYRRALELKSDDALTYYNLGNALRSRGQRDEAGTAYRHALRLQPDDAMASYNLGCVLLEQSRLDEAADAFRVAVQLRPGYPEAHYNLGIVLAGQGQLDAAVAAYRRALELQPEQAAVHSHLIYTLHLQAGEDEELIAREQQKWNRRFSEPLQRFVLPHANDRDPSRRLRIGYLSPDFRFHPVAFFLTPLLEAHDRAAGEIYCYASGGPTDAVTARLRKSAEIWRDVYALADADFADCVRADGIDILVDLSLHTAGNRLPALARKLAPVQVSWLAYPGGSGLDTIDYRLTDARLDPPAQEQAGNSERPVRLPDAWCCYAPIAEFPSVGPLPAIQTGTVTFGSLNRFDKLHEGLLHSWARLLGTVPRSRLVMICPEGQTRDRVQAIFAAHGVTRERIEMIAQGPWPDYTRLLERIDVALDSFPCNGMTTTCHALWMGVPVVTRVGKSAVARAGSSLLHTVGLHEWVAESEADYLRIAAEQAANLPRLAALRATLRARMQSSPLMDAPRFARHLEAAYRAMWRRWCASSPP